MVFPGNHIPYGNSNGEVDGSDLDEGTEECADVAASESDEHQSPVTSVARNRELKRKAAYISEAPATSSSVSHDKRQKTSSSDEANLNNHGVMKKSMLFSPFLVP